MMRHLVNENESRLPNNAARRYHAKKKKKKKIQDSAASRAPGITQQMKTEKN
jgi:hypothetical protein